MQITAHRHGALVPARIGACKHAKSDRLRALPGRPGGRRAGRMRPAMVQQRRRPDPTTGMLFVASLCRLSRCEMPAPGLRNVPPAQAARRVPSTNDLAADPRTPTASTCRHPPSMYADHQEQARCCIHHVHGASKKNNCRKHFLGGYQMKLTHLLGLACAAVVTCVMAGAARAEDKV